MLAACRRGRGSGGPPPSASPPVSLPFRSIHSRACNTAPEPVQAIATNPAKVGPDLADSTALHLLAPSLERVQCTMGLAAAPAAAAGWRAAASDVPWAGCLPLQLVAGQHVITQVQAVGQGRLMWSPCRYRRHLSGRAS